MQTIQAVVNPRLLTKANRLFTGCLSGRIVEILQNARRAGATEVQIINHDGRVAVQDNGSGITDFAKLLDLGASGWDDACDAGEDPCGVGLFCLAPRAVTIRSQGKRLTIAGDGWSGAPVTVEDDPDPVPGTLLEFEDEPWTVYAVEMRAVFCGMQVFVDGAACPKVPFTSAAAAHHPELGCRIEIRRSQDLDPWHRTWLNSRRCCDHALINFYGQVVPLLFERISDRHLNILIEFTGEPTDVRLMLPARTRLVENDAYTQLLDAIEIAAFRFVAQEGAHQLPYREYRRAQELGVVLPEATPKLWYGLLSGESPQAVSIPVPEGFPLAKCYRIDHGFDERRDNDAANAHLLAALGQLDEPFVPVHIHSMYDGYSWADLPRIESVDVTIGKTKYEGDVWGYQLICVDGLDVAVHTSDGRDFASPVSIAIDPEDETCIYVTADAEGALSTGEFWHHFGGWREDDDCYDTQLTCFEEDLDAFWAELVGPHEHLRRQVCDVLTRIDEEWRQVTVSADGSIEITHEDGDTRLIKPPGNTEG